MWQRFWVRGAARDAAFIGDKVFSRPLRTGHFTFEALKRLQTGAMCAIVRGGSHAVVLSASLFRIVISQVSVSRSSLVYFVVRMGLTGIFRQPLSAVIQEAYVRENLEP